MYKIKPKSEDHRSPEYQMAFQMMREIHDELVFGDQVEAYVPNGAGWIVLDCDPRALKDCAEYIWRNNEDYDDPDDLLTIEWVSDWFDGLPKERGDSVDLPYDDMLIIVNALQNEASACRKQAQKNGIVSPEYLNKVAAACDDLRERIKRHLGPAVKN